MAFLLFYAASIVNFDANAGDMPMKIGWYKFVSVYNYFPNLVQDGRNSEIKVDILPTYRRRTITAQDYLEIYFEFFREGIEQLGTPDEVKNLEDFVYGRKKLEVDKKEKYEFIKPLKKISNRKLIFDPSICIDPANYSEDREIPTPMGRFLGRIANTHYNKERVNIKTAGRISKRLVRVENMEWNYIEFKSVVWNYKSIFIKYIKNIDFVAEVLSETPTELHGEVLEKLIKALMTDDPELTEPPVELVEINGTLVYIESKDQSNHAYYRVYRKIGNIKVENFDIEDRIQRIMNRTARDY